MLIKMINYVTPVAFSLILGAVALTNSSCSEKRGPLEKLGREVDDTVGDVTEREETTSEKVGRKIREVGDKIEDRN